MAFDKEQWRIPTPYGRLSWVTLVVTFFASLFFILASFKCFLTYSEIGDLTLYVGYWSKEQEDVAAAAGDNDGNYCVSWDSASKDSLFDGTWRFGKAIGVMGAIVATFLFVMCIYIIFFYIRTHFFFNMLCASLFMAVITPMLLIGLASDVCEVTSCKIGPGGWLAIFDFFLWIGVAYCMWKLQFMSKDPEYEYPPSNPNNKNTLALPPSTTRTRPNVEQEVENVDNDDGTTTRTTTITRYQPQGGKKVDKIKRQLPKEDV